MKSHSVMLPVSCAVQIVVALVGCGQPPADPVSLIQPVNSESVSSQPQGSNSAAAAANVSVLTTTESDAVQHPPRTQAAIPVEIIEPDLPDLADLELRNPLLTDLQTLYLTRASEKYDNAPELAIHRPFNETNEEQKHRLRRISQNIAKHLNGADSGDVASWIDLCNEVWRERFYAPDPDLVLFSYDTKFQVFDAVVELARKGSLSAQSYVLFSLLSFPNSADYEPFSPGSAVHLTNCEIDRESRRRHRSLTDDEVAALKVRMGPVMEARRTLGYGFLMALVSAGDVSATETLARFLWGSQWKCPRVDRKHVALDRARGATLWTQLIAQGTDSTIKNLGWVLESDSIDDPLVQQILNALVERTRSNDDAACLTLAQIYDSRQDHVHESGKSGAEVAAVFSSQAARRGNAAAWHNLSRYYSARYMKAVKVRSADETVIGIDRQKSQFCLEKSAMLGDETAKSILQDRTRREQDSSARLQMYRDNARRSLEADNEAYRREEELGGFIAPRFAYEPVELPPLSDSESEQPVPRSFSDEELLISF